ncbi:hypothetical protein ABMA57_01545 [Saccharospirillum sp. HFRX-1]
MKFSTPLWLGIALLSAILSGCGATDSAGGDGGNTVLSTITDPNGRPETA